MITLMRLTWASIAIAVLFGMQMTPERLNGLAVLIAVSFLVITEPKPEQEKSCEL